MSYGGSMSHQKGLKMTESKLFLHRVLQDFIDRKLSRFEASLVLRLSERTVTRKAKQLQLKGLVGLIHGNVSKSPRNKHPQELKLRILNLVKKKYFDFNAFHLVEMLKKYEKIQISYSTLYSWLRASNLIKKTKRRHKIVRKSRPRHTNEGFMLQMDGSHHK